MCKESDDLSDSSGLVDFAIALLNSVLNLSNRQVKFFGTVINPSHQFFFRASLNDPWATA